MTTGQPPHGKTAHRIQELTLFLVIIGVAALILLRQLTDPSLGYPDADRLLMDGVFFRDFFVDLPLLHPYDYVTSYYGQYPALSIGYRPPLFPFVEGLFNLVLGVETWSSRLALFTFALGGLAAFYLILRRTFDVATATAGALLLVTTPFFAEFGWYTMGEIPLVSMSLITAYFFHRYMTAGRTLDLGLTATALVLALYTKQTALFLALWILIYTVGAGRALGQLKQKRVWVTAILAVVAALPLLAITLWLADQNIAQSVGTGGAVNLDTRLQTSRLLTLPRQLYELHLTLPTLVLALAGFAWALARRDRRLWFWASLIVAVYLFFTYLMNLNARYPIVWIPAFCALAAMPIGLARPGGRLRTALIAILAAIVLYQVWAVYQRTPKFATGYDEAAAYVIEHSESPTVFFDGYNNGYFTYFMRALDPKRSMWVLRGDKLLTSTSIGGSRRLEVHIDDPAGIDSLFDRFGPQFIVVESRNTIGLPAHATLREHLSSSPNFVLRETIPVNTGNPSTREPLQDLDLLVYERVNRPPATGGVLELHLPVVGQTLEIPLRDIGSR
jgi:hypothetical protein